MSEGEHYDNQ